MTQPLMPRDEVAALLGVAPEAVRSTLRRYGIRELRGYPREQVENLERPGQGARTDLPPHTPNPEGEMNNTTMWINRTGRRWDLAHLLRPDSEHEYRGAQYAKTMCGRTVRADVIVRAAFHESCCEHCRLRPTGATA